jgi:DNA replication licensing factor MCM4
MIKTNKKNAKFLAAYISYARIHSRPEISEQAGSQLVKEYQAMRSMGNASKTITATPRQLESMVRISESIARMRLASHVSVQDVEEAVRLIKTAM